MLNALECMIHHVSRGNFQKRCIDTFPTTPEQKLPLELEPIPNASSCLLAERRGDEGFVQHHGIAMGKRSSYSTAQPIFRILDLSKILIKSANLLIKGSTDQCAPRSRNRRPIEMGLGRLGRFSNGVGTTMQLRIRWISLPL